jgi:hypothetical protein
LLGRIVDLHPSRPISGYATAGLPGPKKIKKAKFSPTLVQKRPKRANYQRKFVKIYHEYFGVSVNIVCFVENKLEVALIDTIFFKVQIKAKWTKHIISRKLFEKGQMATLCHCSHLSVSLGNQVSKFHLLFFHGFTHSGILKEEKEQLQQILMIYIGMAH